MQVSMFTTAGCHLCEQAYELLLSVAADTGLEITQVEIGDDDQLVETYGIRIPVVQSEDGRELNWPFSETDIRQLISN
jgi:glutaredoxin